MNRIRMIMVLCLLVPLIGGCAGLADKNGQGHRGSADRFSSSVPKGWQSLTTLPLKYQDLPGIEAGEEILGIVASPDGSGVLLWLNQTTPVAMEVFQKDVYGMMDQRGKAFKADKRVKKYRCMNSYKPYGDLYGIDSYYEYWKCQDSRGKVKGVRRTYFVSSGDQAVSSVSKVLYSNFAAYDSHLMAFSDVSVSETD
ncbi:hypothetical protein [Desulfoluna spongiiphila]|nr:hypothetical protein [Desulfoluna spongiiphila]